MLIILRAHDDFVSFMNWSGRGEYQSTTILQHAIEGGELLYERTDEVVVLWFNLSGLDVNAVRHGDRARVARLRLHRLRAERTQRASRAMEGWSTVTSAGGTV